MTSIPLNPTQVPAFRVQYADSFNAVISTWYSAQVSTSNATWTTLSEPDPANGHLDGVELFQASRKALPEIGKASFRFVYGTFPNGTVSPPPTLIGKEVLLQLQLPDTSWVTIFWGQVDYEEDKFLPGNAVATGERVYHCIDGFARTRKWPMNRHGFDPDGTGSYIVSDSYGNPGYNYYLASDGPLLGNRSQHQYTLNGVNVYAHVWQGAFATDGSASGTYCWNEYDAVYHACSANRALGEPLFQLYNAVNYKSFTPLPVNINESVHSFVSRVCGRQRGRGTVALKWIDVSGQIKVWLEATPLNDADINFTYTDSTAGVVYGAAGLIDAGTSRSLSYKDSTSNYLDFTDDVRTIDSSFFIGTQEGQLYDYVETQGEPIEIAATLSIADTTGTPLSDMYTLTNQLGLAPRWSLTDVTDFEANTMEQRVMNRYWHVYQAFGLPVMWNGEVADAMGTGAALHRIDVRCKDDGSIYQPSLAHASDTSETVCELLPYLPFYDAFRYDGTFPKRTDNSPSNGMPNRRPAQVYLRPAVAGDYWYLPDGELSTNVQDKFNWPKTLGNFNPTVTVAPDYISIVSQKFTPQGMRVMADPSRDAALSANYKLGAEYGIDRLAITIGIRLPYRVHFVSAASSVPYITGATWPTSAFKDWTQAKRKMSLYVPNAHLWCASGACIWDLKPDANANGGEGYTAWRKAMNVTNLTDIAIVRDDRPRLQFLHQLASYWYLNLRKRIQFAQQYCGLIPFTRQDGTSLSTDYPVQINDHIEKATVGGSLQTVSTNVTSVEYDHQSQTTIWSTDYFDLDFSQ